MFTEPRIARKGRGPGACHLSHQQLGWMERAKRPTSWSLGEEIRFPGPSCFLLPCSQPLTSSCVFSILSSRNVTALFQRALADTPGCTTCHSSSCGVAVLPPPSLAPTPPPHGHRDMTDSMGIWPLPHLCPSDLRPRPAFSQCTLSE